MEKILKVKELNITINKKYPGTYRLFFLSFDCYVIFLPKIKWEKMLTRNIVFKVMKRSYKDSTGCTIRKLDKEGNIVSKLIIENSNSVSFRVNDITMYPGGFNEEFNLEDENIKNSLIDLLAHIWGLVKFRSTAQYNTIPNSLELLEEILDSLDAFADTTEKIDLI